MGQSGMAAHGRQSARAAAFIGHRVGIADAEGELGVVVEEERGHVIVKDHQQDIGLLFGEPILDRFVAFKNGGPDGIVLFVFVEGETDVGNWRRRREYLP